MLLNMNNTANITMFIVHASTIYDINVSIISYFKLIKNIKQIKIIDV